MQTENRSRGSFYFLRIKDEARITSFQELWLDRTILKIKSGQTEFDPAYSINMTDVNIESEVTMLLLYFVHNMVAMGNYICKPVSLPIGAIRQVS